MYSGHVPTFLDAGFLPTNCQNAFQKLYCSQKLSTRDHLWRNNCLSLFHYLSDMTFFIHSKVGHHYPFAVKMFCHSTWQKRTIHAIQSATVPIASFHFLSTVTAPKLSLMFCSSRVPGGRAPSPLVSVAAGVWCRAEGWVSGYWASAVCFLPSHTGWRGKGSNQCQWEYYARFSENTRK